MVSLVMNLGEEPVWPELLQKKPEEIIHIADDIKVTALDRGMKSGAPSIALRIDLPGGETVIAETSLKLFLTAADILKAKYGDPRH